MRISLPSLRGVQAQIGGADGLLDGADLGDVPGLDGDQRRLGNVQVADLVERRGRAVVIDADVVENADRRAAGADGGHVVLQIVDGLLHASLGVGLDFLHGLERVCRRIRS